MSDFEFDKSRPNTNPTPIIAPDPELTVRTYKETITSIGVKSMMEFQIHKDPPVSGFWTGSEYVIEPVAQMRGINSMLSKGQLIKLRTLIDATIPLL